MASTDINSQLDHDQVPESRPDGPALRPSAEKRPLTSLAVDRLPDEIIEQILQVADPDSFASLILVNSKWRRVSQQVHLYAHHLQKCASYAASHSASPRDDNDDSDNGSEQDHEQKLHDLRKAFAREVKRNLFEAYLRPSETTIKLISNSISSSSCPGGESMQFSPSPRGHHLLAYNSSRIYVIDVRNDTVDVTRELKILRRPVSTCIKDDGSRLAVLSSEMQVDLYDLNESPPRRTQSMVLDHAPRTIAMSPCGSVLAAAYDGGIEVSSLNPGALPTDRRSVKCDAVDTLAFSFDGTQLLGTTIQSSSPNTVVLTAPYYDPANIVDNNMIALWTTSILFPNTSRDCSHAVLLQDTSQEEAAWTFTYDRSFETFRAVRIDDLRNGTTYFTGPIPSPRDQVKLLPSTSPSATYHGDLVAAAFKGKDVWVYGVPEDLDAVAECASSASCDNNGLAALGGRRSNGEAPSRTPSSRARESGARPQWQLLCDKLRNTFVWGTQVAEVEGVDCAKWVCGFGGSSSRERLVIAARGVTPPGPITEPGDIDFIDGGRITLLDFDYGIEDGVKREITIEVGTNEPEVLEEEQRDMATEVAIVRRRTVAQRTGNRGALLRAATTAGTRAATPPVPDIPPPSNHHRATVNDDDDDDPLVPRRIGLPPRPTGRPSTSEGVPEESESASLIEAQEAVDAPYSHDNPRSTTTLRRAATAAAVNRRRNPPPPVAGQVTYSRADGRREHPHESDADNWVPPPPPYQKEDPGDVPAFLRHAAVRPENDGPATSLPIARHQTAAPTMGPSVAPTHVLSTHRRIASDGTSVSRLQSEELARPTTSASIQISNHTSSHVPLNDDDIYDVSPPDSPRLTAQPSSSNAQATEPRMQPPNLALRIPSPMFGAPVDPSNHAQGRPGSGEPIPGGQVATATTWAPGSGELTHSASWHGHAHTAPPIGASADEMIAATFPPLPNGPDPRSSLGSRGSAGHSSVPRVRLGSRGENVPHGDLSPLPQHIPLPHTPLQPASNPPAEDQPLIISTPDGVSGVFDPPGTHDLGPPRSETPILAPIPRHPHTDPDGRNTAERLDPSYVPPSTRTPRSLMPSWLSAPSTTPNGQRSNGSLNRKASRAERSAAKNMQDAKRRGWKGTRKGRKKHVDHEVASAAAWTDVSAVSRTQATDSKKHRKCVVM
ncbi:hypothetical protein ACRALDRAFT_1030011 [Sodiomyces alcalophilus JCM 7366]|uniref:uncharacterized protein n=1 Tax=Sodiomyces alcalophilus JCM 7366 TaxID=591952 RepID=UPI0039B5DF8C